MQDETTAVAAAADAGALPVVEGRWVRPSADFPAEPRWGSADGLQVGLAPLPGPRGLLRLYAPYLDHGRTQLVNFVAVEPIPAGTTERGFSELEPSALDGVAGKRFWTADDPDDATPRDPQRPARGVLDTVDGVERLTVWVLVEPYDNGADVYVRIRFRADRPYEVGLAAYRRESSTELAACVLTATMGNYARLRKLQLSDRTVTPAELWPGYADAHFTDHARFGVSELQRDGRVVVVSAEPDEASPADAVYAPDTNEHWKYSGRLAVQTWRAEDPDPGLEVLVNGRWAYWASVSPIPGGVAFENFELLEPFRQGRELLFAVAPANPDA